jgi:hypothetical protein
MLACLPARFMRAALRTLVPAYANAVFVVYCRDLFEPLTSAEHVKAFLEQVPDDDETVATAASAHMPPLTVYCGGGRVICRDPECRKIIVPARAALLLSALMDGQNPVAELRAHLAPIFAGARKIVDYGAGIGLLARAAKDTAAEDGVIMAIETEPLRVRCLTANIDLARMYGRVLIMRERPLSLSAAECDAGTLQAIAWPAGHGSRTGDASCDVLHVDLDFGLDENLSGIVDFVARNSRPVVVLSRGLAGRTEPSGGTDETIVITRLQALGYRSETHNLTATASKLTVLRAASNGEQPSAVTGGDGQFKPPRI